MGASILSPRETVRRLIDAGAVVVSGLNSQTQAVRNARIAATELARRRVERTEVELFLEGVDEAPAVPHQRRVN